MRINFFKLLLLIVVSIMSNASLLAQYEWEEWPTNPLAIHGASGSWDESVVTPCVIFNSDLNRYEMWFGTFDGTYPNNGIGFAWSTDGINWTKHPTPVITPSGAGWDAVSVGECSVIKEGNVYKMWYTGHPNSTRTPSYIGYATSTNCTTWTKHGDPVLSPGTGWESARVEFPSVIKVTGGYWMFYTGELAHTVARTGRAFSTDGINWQKDTVNNPVLLPGDPGEWDQNNYLGNVIELNNTLYIYYTANPDGGGTAIGVASSTDMGITWTKYSGNPIIQQGTTGQWDDGWIETGCAVFAHNQLRLYYDGGSPSTGWLGRIGLATSTYSIDTLYVPQEYSTIQEAINAAVDGNLVLVDDGTYMENINFKGKAITVASRFFIDGDEFHIANTIINGSQPTYPDSASVVTFRSGEDTTSVICGFTITGGTGTNFFSDAITKRLGGGIFVYYSNATIKNNIIETNTISHSNDAFGGGIGAYSQNANNYIIENNIVRNNSIITPVITYYSLGGGIYSGTKGKVRIFNNEVKENSITAPEAWGGGILPANFGGGSYLICNNIISGNYIYATTGGSGGLDIYNHSPVVKNNLIFLNSAPKGGGACIENASPIFANNIIAYNTATGSGGGLEVVAPVPELINCIVWGNSATTGSQINGTANVSYSDVEGGYTGTGNLNTDPLFRDAASGDFHLQSTDCGYSFNSPCIDAGNPAYEDSPLSCDWGLGQVRSDMGAFGGMNSVVDVPEEDIELPSDYVLYQNYPNPFNPSTKIKYSVPQSSNVVIKVFDVLGNEIETLVNEEKPAGTYELTWYAEQLPSGVYFYQLRAGDYVQTRKMILLK